MSEGEYNLGMLLHDEYPHSRILSQHYVAFQRKRLFFDFYIPSLRLAFEYDGVQHDKYVPFFHGSKQGFENGVRRDSLKHEWAAANGVRVIRIKSHERVTAGVLRRKILEQT